MNSQTDILAKLETSRAKLAKNSKRMAWREKNGFTKTFSCLGNPEKKPLSPPLQLIHNVGDYCAGRIAKSINKSIATSAQAQSYTSNSPHAKKAFSKLKSIAPEKRAKNGGNFFEFSPCDMQEIYGIASYVLASVGFFDDSSPFTHAEIERSLLDVIINEIKAKNGLELNRFKNGKHASIEEMLEKDGFIHHSEMLPALKKSFQQKALEKVAENNEDFDSLSEKIDAIHSMIDCFHDTSVSRQRETMRAKDKQFFLALLNSNATGNGESREQFLMQAKRFLERLIEGYQKILENSNDGTKFHSFEHLAVLFKAMR